MFSLSQSNTWKSARGLYTQNLHVDVPIFGDWGFVIAARHHFKIVDLKLANVDTQYLTPCVLHTLDSFGKDIDHNIYEDGKKVVFKPNTLIHPNLIEMYQKAWLYY